MRYKYPLIIGYTSWCGLGFYRGLNYYKYKTKTNHLYTDSFIQGFFGLFIYTNPVFLPFTTYKELYRLEVNMRNLQEEKKSDYYNTILL